MLEQGLAHIDLLLQQRDQRLDLGHHCRGGRTLGLLLRQLAAQRGDLAAMLGGLRCQVLALGGDEQRACPVRRMEIGERIGTVGEGGAQPGDIELGGDEIALQVLALSPCDRRVELDQHIAGLHGVTVMHMDRADEADLEGLDDLRPSARDDLARRGGDDVDGADAGPGHGQHEHGNDRDTDRPPDWRRRCLDDLERRR